MTCFIIRLFHAYYERILGKYRRRSTVCRKRVVALSHSLTLALSHFLTFSLFYSIRLKEGTELDEIIPKKVTFGCRFDQSHTGGIP